MAMHAAIDAARGAVDSIKGDIAQAEALSARARQVASTDSLTRPLGELLAREGNMINAPVLVAEGLAKYDTMRQQLEEISANLPRRKDTLERARVGLLSFVPSANSASPNVGGGDRTARILNDIESAFLAAQEISGNLREGRKFYDDLDRVLNELFRQATDFAAARALESKDLLAEITAAIASGTPPPLPARPGQFMPGVWDQDQPPRFSRPGGGR
ncbi:hypothetical protein BC828DRAFT_408538 [Blastocladiella britannica]|nr:hypothetical protein BC828DRAFT_408538 [Blastocladiella britannica]